MLLKWLVHENVWHHLFQTCQRQTSEKSNDKNTKQKSPKPFQPLQKILCSCTITEAEVILIIFTQNANMHQNILIAFLVISLESHSGVCVVLFLPIWSSRTQGPHSPLREQPWHRLLSIKWERGGSEQPSSVPPPSPSAIHSYCDRWARVPLRHARHQTTVSCVSATKIVLPPSAGASWTLTRVTLTKREIGFNPPRAVHSWAAG